MEPTTPMGSRRMVEVWSPEYSADAWPSRRRAAPAKNATLSIEPGTSNSRASRIGLPVCAVSAWASSSAIGPRWAASATSAPERSAGVARDHWGYAAAAAETAASTVAGSSAR
jgi:hypothetical protein